MVIRAHSISFTFLNEYIIHLFYVERLCRNAVEIVAHLSQQFSLDLIRNRTCDACPESIGQYLNEPFAYSTEHIRFVFIPYDLFIVEIFGKCRNASKRIDLQAFVK